MSGRSGKTWLGEILHIANIAYILDSEILWSTNHLARGLTQISIISRRRKHFWHPKIEG